jgi:hypothetical protein
MGPITVNNLTAKDSATSSGAELNNQSAAGTWAIKLTGTNLFTGNSQSGVEIWANGAVTVNNVTATGSATGMLIDNDALGIGSPQTVTVTGVNNFNYNDFYGLQIRSHGVVTLSKVTADGSTFGSGVYITTSANITITCGSMTNNDVNGLMYNTPGLVTLKGVVASGNGTADFSIGGGGTLVVVRTC